VESWETLDLIACSDRLVLSGVYFREILGWVPSCHLLSGLGVLRGQTLAVSTMKV